MALPAATRVDHASGDRVPGKIAQNNRQIAAQQFSNWWPNQVTVHRSVT
jgi:hypothetical protein